MSASSDYLRILTDITQQKGATAAATQRANSQIWGNTIAKLGEMVPAEIRQYGIDKKQKQQDADDAALRKLFTDASSAWQAQQSTQQVAQQTGNAPGTPAVPNFMGPQAPSQAASPFPSPAAILSAVGPVRGIPIVNGIAALHVAPTQDPEKNLARLQAVWKGLDAMPEDQRAEAYPHIIDLFEKQGLITPGQVNKQYDPTEWKAIGATLKQDPKLSEPFTLSEGQKRFDAQGNEIAGVPKPASESGFTLAPGSVRYDAQGNQSAEAPKDTSLTPYQTEELKRRDQELTLQRQRLDLAVKQSNKPAITAAASGLADTVINHPDLFAQLTPSEKAKIAPELDQRGFKNFAKPPSATMENRLASAKAVQQTGQDIVRSLSDPNIAAKVGPAMGRFNTLRDFIGNPPPELSELAGSIESYALANMGVHGMRSTQGADEIKKLLDQKHTPESLIKTIQGIGKFSDHLLENEGRGVSAPPAAVVPPADTGRVRVKGPKGETGSVPKGTTLPPGWSLQ